MSAAVACDADQIDPFIAGIRPRRHLRALPDLEPDPAQQPLRITRTGRLVLLAMAVAVALVVTTSVVGALAAGGPHTVQVRSGQTLSEVAARELPQLPIAEGVAQLQLANEMSTSQVHAGQVLTIPSVG